MADGPDDYQAISPEDQKRATAFFSKGQTVAGTGNYEYAIEMYLQGLAIDPEAVDAHQTLREISLKRKASGGKPLGMFQAMKLKGGKDEKEQLLMSEINKELLATSAQLGAASCSLTLVDPDSFVYREQFENVLAANEPLVLARLAALAKNSSAEAYAPHFSGPFNAPVMSTFCAKP